MSARPRVARAGDVCLLLEPGRDELPRLRQRQAALQARFGGRPHRRVHLTFQRFELGDESRVAPMVRGLADSLVGLPPIPLVAVSLAQLEAPFWGMRQLRWCIQGSAALSWLGRRTEAGLVAAGVTPHFFGGRNWNPTLVTALDQVPESDMAAHLAELTFPRPLFTGRWVVVSKILGRARFEILDRIELYDE